MPKHRNIDHKRCVGDNLRYLRRQNRMTQAAVGDVLGVSMQQVQKYESGANALPLAAVAVLADLFGVSADMLLRQEGGMPPGDMQNDRDMTALYYTIAGIHDPALRRKIHRVVEILAA